MQKRLGCLVLSAVLGLAGILPAVAVEPTTIVEDKTQEGVLYFNQVEESVRNGNYTVRSCAESLASLNTINRAGTYKSLQKANNALVDAIWGLQQSGRDTTSLRAQMNSIQEQMEGFEEENYQKTYEDAKRQIEGAMDQIVKGVESLYFGILTMENQMETLDNSVDALDRAIRVMEIRCQLGQASNETLRALQDQKVTVESQRASLQSNLKTSKMNLQVMIGQNPDGTIQVVAPEAVTEDQLQTIDFAADLEAGKEKSLTLYQNRRTVEDKKDDWKEKPDSPKLTHDYQNTVYALKAAQENFAQTASTMYTTLLDKKRLYVTAQKDFKSAQKTFSVSEKQHELGMISKQDMLNAQDQVKDAEIAQSKAKIDLMNAYAGYQWLCRGIAEA